MTGCTLCWPPRISTASVSSFLLSVPLAVNPSFWWNTLSAKHSWAADGENRAPSEIGLESTSVLCFSHGICQTWKNIGHKPSLLESYFLKVVKDVIYLMSGLYTVGKFTISPSVTGKCILSVGLLTDCLVSHSASTLGQEERLWEHKLSDLLNGVPCLLEESLNFSSVLWLLTPPLHFQCVFTLVTCFKAEKLQLIVAFSFFTSVTHQQ